MFSEAQMHAFKEHVEDQGVRPCAGEGTVRTGRFSGRTCEQAWPILLREKGLAATEKWCRTMGCRWQNLNMSRIKQLTEQHEETPPLPPATVGAAHGTPQMITAKAIEAQLAAEVSAKLS